MGASSFNAMELDAIGEIMNISLGASATAISTLLGTKVNITTPVAQVLSSDEFSFKRMEPAVGVDIAYVKGLSGSNVMIFRRNDVRVIVGIMMGMEIPEEEFELDEMNISVVCEVMNQMMGSSATALSEFLGYTVDISTPKSFEITDDISFKERYFPSGTEQVLVRFNLEIGDSLKSEFMNIMTIDLIKRLLAPFAESLGLDEADVTPGPVVEPEDSIIRADGAVSQEEVQVATVSEPAAAPSGDAMMSQEEIQALMAGNAPEPAAAPSGDAMMSQEEIQAMMAAEQQKTASPAPQPAPAQAAMPAQPVYQAPVYQQPAAMDPMMMQLMSQMQQSQMQMMEMMNQMKQEHASVQQQAAAAPRPNTVIHPVNSPKFAEDHGLGVE